MSKNFNIIRSPLFYVGDKFKLIPQLKKIFPNNINRLIEPFCGGGSIFLNIDAKSYILNDINYYLIEIHKLLFSFVDRRDLFFNKIESYIYKYNLSASYLNINVSDELKIKFKKTYFAKYNKESYIKMRTDFNNNKEDFILLYLLIIYGFNRMIRFNSKGDFNLPVGNVDFNINVLNSLNNYFAIMNNKKILFENKDFEDFISSIYFEKDDFVYIDPPYLISFSEYNKNWNEDEENRLLNLVDILNNRNIKFALSNIISYKNKYNSIFDNWSKKYNIIKIDSNYISYHDNKNKDIIEVVVTNY